MGLGRFTGGEACAVSSDGTVSRRNLEDGVLENTGRKMSPDEYERMQEALREFRGTDQPNLSDEERAALNARFQETVDAHARCEPPLISQRKPTGHSLS
jgi:DNA-binding GntR family transcriptional regulator